MYDLATSVRRQSVGVAISIYDVLKDETKTMGLLDELKNDPAKQGLLSYYFKNYRRQSDWETAT
jgi:hypothetical protein